MEQNLWCEKNKGLVSMQLLSGIISCCNLSSENCSLKTIPSFTTNKFNSFYNLIMKLIENSHPCFFYITLGL